MKFQISKQSAMQTLRETIRKIEIDLDADDEELSEEEIAEAEKEQEEFKKAFSSLRLARKYLFRRSDEEAVLAYTYNTVIDAKLILRSEHYSHKFRKTSYTKRVRSFDCLKFRYKKASLKSIEFKLRQIVVQAMFSELSRVDENYSAAAFIDLMFASNLLDHISRIDYVEHIRNIISENKKLL